MLVLLDLAVRQSSPNFSCPKWSSVFLFLFVLLANLVASGLPATDLSSRWKREKAFDLLKIETDLETAEENEKAAVSGRSLPSRMLRRDDALNDERCQKRCNEKLRSGLDMVKAHSAFGSVGVPSVLDQLDLQMFCRLDSAHDKCLRDCGYEIQFNMRDYVCRERYSEMVANLACYERSAASLKRHCGASVCGPYSELEISLLGFAQRCRHLLCDLSCTETILVRRCGSGPGARATQFLIDYSRAQVSTWMKDMAKNMKKSVPQIMPASCSRLYCDPFDAEHCNSSVVVLQSSQGKI